jgi:hypothetical protein
MQLAAKKHNCGNANFCHSFGSLSHGPAGYNFALHWGTGIAPYGGML